MLQINTRLDFLPTKQHKVLNFSVVAREKLRITLVQKEQEKTKQEGNEEVMSIDGVG